MPLSEAQLANLPSDVYSLSKDERKAAYAVVGRGMCGTSDHLPEPANHWQIGPELQNCDDPQRREVVEFIMTVYLEAQHNPDWEGSEFLATRDADGAITAVALCHRMEAGEESFLSKLASPFRRASALFAAAKSGVPGLFADKLPADQQKVAKVRASIRLRGSAVEEGVDHMHAASQPSAHWYVAALAVEPESQGKGLGKKLLSAVSRIADSEGLPCYLDCGSERHCRIYERSGYSVVCQKAIKVTDVPEEVPGEWPEEQVEYGLTRSPQAM